jgi:hypothetical protein
MRPGAPLPPNHEPFLRQNPLGLERLIKRRNSDLEDGQGTRADDVVLSEHPLTRFAAGTGWSGFFHCDPPTTQNIRNGAENPYVPCKAVSKNFKL